jgi:tRNA nucleotidyltransferase (CCA-adding enzyme)
MSQLKPGATYIYERANGVVYAREFGADPSTRFEIGYDYNPITGQKIPHQWDSRTPDGRPLHDHLREDQLWGQIRRAARTNPTLQDALERAIMIYQLSKTDE